MPLIHCVLLVSTSLQKDWLLCQLSKDKRCYLADSIHVYVGNWGIRTRHGRWMIKNYGRAILPTWQVHFHCQINTRLDGMFITAPSLCHLQRSVLKFMISTRHRRGGQAGRAGGVGRETLPFSTKLTHAAETAHSSFFSISACCLTKYIAAPGWQAV